jgi:SAM-dependent methyltransferase
MKPWLRGSRADARSLPFASGSFATVVSLSTLDHFENEAELMVSLAELRRVCSPGGRLVLTLDNPTNPLIWLRGALPYSWLSRTGIVPYFVGANLDARRLSSALRSLGFEIEAQKALVHVPRVLAIAACRALERSRSLRLRRAWLALLMRFEALERWPTRFVTGHFVAIRARTPRA